MIPWIQNIADALNLTPEEIVELETFPLRVIEYIEMLKYLSPDEIQIFKEWLNKKY